MKSVYRLLPAYRHGKDTPWGGDALGRVFGMDIPDGHTGEALIASTLPGLESRLPDGRALTELAGGPLPLLLKLIDAREALSVQVHPDDAYAAAHEGGKLGKSEAWLILHAEPGARLVYGLLPGTELASVTGKEIEAQLRWVDVHAGDVLYIPAGMVHAIGPGILLYEIQQSSDVTYRFWDWDRRDAQGNPRQLHWRQACDVSRVDLQMDSAPGQARALQGGGTLVRYLQTEYFTLDRLQVAGEATLPARVGFQLVTALCGGRIEQDGVSEAFAPADTFYVEPGARGVHIHAQGDLLISAQGIEGA